MPFSIRNNFGRNISHNIYNVGFQAQLRVAASSRTPIRRSAPKFYPSQGMKPSPRVLKTVGLTSSTSACSGIALQDQLDGRLIRYPWRHLSTFVDANYAPYSLVNSSGGAWSALSATAAASTEQRRQYDAASTCAWHPGRITYLLSDQTSNYNGLQVSATKRMSRGFTVSGSMSGAARWKALSSWRMEAERARISATLASPFTRATTPWRHRRGLGRIWPHE